MLQNHPLLKVSAQCIDSSLQRPPEIHHTEVKPSLVVVANSPLTIFNKLRLGLRS